MNFHAPLSPEYSRSLGCGTVVIFLYFLLAVLLGELTFRITLMAVLGYLGGVAVVASRRPQTPAEDDLYLLRWGFIPLWFWTQVGVRLAWSWMGRL